MTQTSSGPRFALESFDELFVAHELWRDQLQSHVAIGAKVSGEIDGAHAAPAEQSFQAIFIVEDLPDVFLEWGHCGNANCQFARKLTASIPKRIAPALLSQLVVRPKCLMKFNTRMR